MWPALPCGELLPRLFCIVGKETLTLVCRTIFKYEPSLFKKRFYLKILTNIQIQEKNTLQPNFVLEKLEEKSTGNARK